jgi:hypothetical protein
MSTLVPRTSEQPPHSRSIAGARGHHRRRVAGRRRAAARRHVVVALLGLVHLGVARLVLVLGRAMIVASTMVRARISSPCREVRVDLVEQRPGEVVVLQQAPELQQRRGVRHRLARQVDAREVAQRLALVQRVLQCLVGQAVPLLVGYSGSITAIRRVHGTMRSISARNFSRRVRFFFIAYSALASRCGHRRRPTMRRLRRHGR